MTLVQRLLWNEERLRNKRNERNKRKIYGFRLFRSFRLFRNLSSFHKHKNLTRYEALPVGQLSLPAAPEHNRQATRLEPGALKHRRTSSGRSHSLQRGASSSSVSTPARRPIRSARRSMSSSSHI